MDTIVTHVKHRTKFKEWRCGGCGSLLGLCYPDGTLTLKYKDLTAWIVGEIKVVCRHCKCMNTFNSRIKLENSDLLNDVN